MPPVGFGRRTEDGTFCLNPGCRNTHEDVPEADLDAAKELKIYLIDKEKVKAQGGGTQSSKGKDGGKGWRKGGRGKNGGKDLHKGGDNGKGSPASATGKGDDPVWNNDSWAGYVKGK